jgi:HlyD family secretion protein
MNAIRRPFHFGILLLVLCAGAMGFVVGMYWPQRQPKSILAPKKLAPLGVPNRVSAWGRLAPQSDVIPLSAAANQLVACVEELLVAEGDEIIQGQPIAILDSHERRKATVEEAQARVASAQAKLEAVQAGAKPEEIAVQNALIEANQAELDDAKQQHERATRLAATNSISDEDQAQRLMRWRKATASLNQARQQLESIKNPRAEDIAFARAEVALAKNSLAVAQADLEQSVIRSPIKGQVLQVHARQGERIGEKGVVDIGDTHLMHAIAEVYEEDIGRIALGQTADVNVPSLKCDLRGKVERISRIVARKSVFSNDPVEDTDARVVEVRIVLDAEDSRRVAGLSNARIHARIDAPPIQRTSNDDSNKSTTNAVVPAEQAP